LAFLPRKPEHGSEFSLSQTIKDLANRNRHVAGLIGYRIAPGIGGPTSALDRIWGYRIYRHRNDFDCLGVQPARPSSSSRCDSTSWIQSPTRCLVLEAPCQFPAPKKIFRSRCRDRLARRFVINRQPFTVPGRWRPRDSMALRSSTWPEVWCR